MASQHSHILITGAAGFIGQELLVALLASSPSLTITATDTTLPPVPPAHAHRVTALAADLTAPTAVSALFQPKPPSAVYLLHGLMSSGSEANLELGLAVNFDSVRNVLDYIRREHPGTVVVFTSSCAVYGREECVSEAATVPLPQTSYGAEKLMVELLVNDWSRRGLLDGRIVRLPTVVVRPGRPSAAASSFCSGIVRESLKGEANILPVSPDTEMWVCSPATVVRNLLRVATVPSAQFGGSRIVNLPGRTVTVHEILAAVEKVGGKAARALVTEKKDAEVERIVESWSARFDVSRAYGLGLEADGSIEDAVRAFKTRLESEKA